MRHFLAGAFALALMACGQGARPASAQDETWSREEIEQVVREYILENPELIEEALIELQRRAREREQQALFEGVAAAGAELFQDPRDPVAGAEDARLTIVEFFDYKCPYCRVTNDWVETTLAEHGDEVRFVFKEFPVLGPESEQAALAALAVWNTQPDAYLPFHNALMQASRPLPDSRIDDIAAEAGVDVEAMRAAMEDDALQAHIEDVYGLARRIGISGTPFFVVGDEVIAGADVSGLERALNERLGE
ncbi:DsbA family protein [Marinicauda algicola]|uniref:DsbA family protein n=1 Tax=Marinicauda algicola TaxID=2029849 RepID=A0A4S2H262_9PROT|nr:DsbA family protein [Marinicauda algicola]TGY89604.1 DsbA family protein [Marinicauda algicola]